MSKKAYFRTGGEGPLTGEEFKAAAACLDDDVEIGFSAVLAGELRFYRFKWRGPKRLTIELEEVDL
jgi:hypothetical protein